VILESLILTRVPGTMYLEHLLVLLSPQDEPAFGFGFPVSVMDVVTVKIEN